MPENLSPELNDLAARCASFADDVLLPLATNGTDPQTAGAQVVEHSRSAGFFQMTQPVDFGGSAADPLSLVVVRETLASRNPPYLHRVFGPGPGVLGGCNDHLREHYLEPLLAGRKRGGFGFTEPDTAPKHTWAREDGDDLIVTGQKSYVTGGGDADFVNALVDIEERGMAMVVIDTDAPGVEKERLFRSLDGSHHAAFRFDAVRVPAANVIGEPGAGLPRAMGQILDTRLAIAAECSGLAIWVLDFLENYLNAPHRSGKPLSSREGVRIRYAELRIQAFAVRSVLYRTARLATAGENIINEGIMTKVFSTEAIGNIVDGAIQLVGGIALVDDHPLAALYQKVRSLRLAEGATDVLKLNLSRGRFELGKGRV